MRPVSTSAARCFSGSSSVSELITPAGYDLQDFPILDEPVVCNRELSAGGQRGLKTDDKTRSQAESGHFDLRSDQVGQGLHANSTSSGRPKLGVQYRSVTRGVVEL